MTMVDELWSWRTGESATQSCHPTAFTLTLLDRFLILLTIQRLPRAFSSGVERLLCMLKVMGSIPIMSKIFLPLESALSSDFAVTLSTVIWRIFLTSWPTFTTSGQLTESSASISLLYSIHASRVTCLWMILISTMSSSSGLRVLNTEKLFQALILNSVVIFVQNIAGDNFLI